MINTVFLDMDGVLVAFEEGVHKAFNIPYDYQNYPYEKGKWDVYTDGDIGYTFKEINNKCNINFWDNLEWMHDGCDILQAIWKIFNPKDIYLLTTPMPNLESASGKMMWIRDNLPLYLKRTIITQAPKHLLARPDTLLIDDKDENVDEFREAGGKGILINRPWNAGHKRADRTVGDLIYELEKYT